MKELKRELKREHTEGAHRGSTQREHTESKRLEVIHLEEEKELVISKEVIETKLKLKLSNQKYSH